MSRPVVSRACAVALAVVALTCTIVDVDAAPRAVGADSAALVDAVDPIGSDPEVLAAEQRVTAAVRGDENARTALETAKRTEADAVERYESTAAELSGIDAEVAETGAAEAAALEQHAESRRSTVDAAVAAYVAGAPDSLELKAALIAEPEERSRSMALAETVGDVFAGRAEKFRETGDALGGQLRDLADVRAGAAGAANDAQRDLEGARRSLADAETAVAAATSELESANAGVVTARASAKRRVDEAAERFRLGSIDLDELRKMGDDRVAVDDVPVRAYEAYTRASRQVDAEMPGCKISWWAIAAIGKIETRHGAHGGAVILPNGDVAPRILGPRLTGGAFAVVTDSDDGRYDGDAEYDRAVGPMQFIPSTWAASGADGNGDGVADPHNYYDAATAAARYLCRGARGRPLDTVDGMRAAALSYNRSEFYASEVIAAARRYGGLVGTDATPTSVPG